MCVYDKYAVCTKGGPHRYYRVQNPMKQLVIDIYATMIYTAPVSNAVDACKSITRASGRGMGPGNQDFLGPCEMASSL
jgi:hypothetical protein